MFEDLEKIVSWSYLLTIVLLSLFILGGFVLINQLKKIPGEKASECVDDKDCEWVITNCCPENAGAYWECVSLKTYKSKPCPKDIICPQFISPKPSKRCFCEEGRCVSET